MKAHDFVARHGEQNADSDYSNRIQGLLSSLGADTKTEDGRSVHTFDDGSQAVTRPSDEDVNKMLALLLGEDGQEIDPEDESENGDDEDEDEESDEDSDDDE